MQLERAIALSRAKQKKCICKVVMIYAKIAFFVSVSVYHNVCDRYGI